MATKIDAEISILKTHFLTQKFDICKIVVFRPLALRLQSPQKWVKDFLRGEESPGI